MAGIAASGSSVSGGFGGRFGPQKKKPNPVEDMYKVYGSAVKQQAGDYDDIMSKYKNVFDSSNNAAAAPKTSFTGYTPTLAGGGGYQPYTPDLATYNKSADSTAALSSLRNLSETGGLNETEQGDLRARGVSPIRAMYATADRDMNRQRSLSGGYSPNFGAVTSRMARDQSSLISDATQNVNAGIAEMVQRGKLSAAPQYANAAQAESELANSFETNNTNAKNDAKRFNLSNLFDMSRFNAGAQNDAGRFNASGQNDNDRFNATNEIDAAKLHSGNKLSAAGGMANLYGTTPALVNTFGNQAADTAQFQNSVNQNKKKMGLSAFQAYRSGGRGGY